tara:strand:- start:1718 stop:1921 length:204 start_codon:yes stop_codon:yes gene_type:complete
MMQARKESSDGCCCCTTVDGSIFGRMSAMQMIARGRAGARDVQAVATNRASAMCPAVAQTKAEFLAE